MESLTPPRDRVRSHSAPHISIQRSSTAEEGDAVLEQPPETPPPPKIDINTLKNEILTDGMQVSCLYILF